MVWWQRRWSLFLTIDVKDSAGGSVQYFARRANTQIAECPQVFSMNHSAEPVCIIFEQKQIMASAELLVAPNILRLSEIMHHDDCTAFRLTCYKFKSLPLRLKGIANRIVDHLKRKLPDWMQQYFADVVWYQNPIASFKAQTHQSILKRSSGIGKIIHDFRPTRTLLAKSKVLNGRIHAHIEINIAGRLSRQKGLRISRAFLESPIRQETIAS